MKREFLRETELAYLVNHVSLDYRKYENQEYFNLNYRDHSYILDFLSDRFKFKKIGFSIGGNERKSRELSLGIQLEVERNTEKIRDNWKEGVELLTDVDYGESREIIIKGVKILVEPTQESKKLVTEYLEEYISAYENNKLHSEQNFFKYEKHLDLFINRLQNFWDNFGENVNSFTFERYKENSKEGFGIDGFRYVEFMLLMQKREYIRLRKIYLFQEEGKSYSFQWQYELEILKDPKEIKKNEDKVTNKDIVEIEVICKDDEECDFRNIKTKHSQKISKQQAWFIWYLEQNKSDNYIKYSNLKAKAKNYFGSNHSFDSGYSGLFDKRKFISVRDVIESNNTTGPGSAYKIKESIHINFNNDDIFRKKNETLKNLLGTN